MMLLAIVFIALFSITLTLAPAARLHSWQTNFLWNHWIGFVIWIIGFLFAHFLSLIWLPDRDPYLLPITAILTGWGMMAIWRLDPELGLRQSLWVAVGISILIIGMRFPSILSFLRRYKYIWFTSVLALTAATLIFGTNPLGSGPKMWLGCCGLYLQPSEPLKLLLIVYLAGYLADRSNFVLNAKIDKKELEESSDGYLKEKTRNKNQKNTGTFWLPFLAPTLVIVLLALTLLIIQKDLGTAFTILFLYSAIIYIISGNKKILLISLLILVISIALGFYLFEVVRLRIETWLNPWQDPSGSSYQIVQSLISIANGGYFGRGPGIGYPYLVPISHSDFIFAAISEEIGLVGALGLLLILCLMVNRGLSIAISTPGIFRSFLAAGLTTLLVSQGLLIIGGNLRLLPLTGVTLPLVSYGGSSLITSMLAILFLLHISVPTDEETFKPPDTSPIIHLGTLLYLGLSVCALGLGWWTIYRSSELLSRTDNPRRAINDLFVQRGAILDRNNKVINATNGIPGEYHRRTDYPALSNIVGYTDPTFGQSGLEASMDDYLRGLKGNPELEVWWNHFLYGQPPKGLDIRLSLDLDLQKIADEQMKGHEGALVLINSRTGEILAMASSPTFDSNNLVEEWENLITDGATPLFNRAVQGLYNPGAILGALNFAEAYELDELPDLPAELSMNVEGEDLNCITNLSELNWKQAIGSGCPAAVAALGKSIGAEALTNFYMELGIYDSPKIRLPSASSPPQEKNMDATEISLGKSLKVSPLQVAYAASPISSGGILPSRSLVTAIKSNENGWTILPGQEKQQKIFSAETAQKISNELTQDGKAYWQSIAISPADPKNSNQNGIWLIAGTLPNSLGTPLTLALMLESGDTLSAQQIADAILQSTFTP